VWTRWCLVGCDAEDRHSRRAGKKGAHVSVTKGDCRRLGMGGSGMMGSVCVNSAAGPGEAADPLGGARTVAAGHGHGAASSLADNQRRMPLSYRRRGWMVMRVRRGPCG
jgi:hypothetical protein